PVTDLAIGSTPAGVQNCIHGRLDEILIHRNLELNLAEQVYSNLMPAVNLGVTLLPPEALHIHHCQSEDLDPGEGLLNGLKLRRLNNRDDEFHLKNSQEWPQCPG